MSQSVKSQSVKLQSVKSQSVKSQSVKPSKTKSSKKVIKISKSDEQEKKTTIRDLDKIIANPEEYARSVTIERLVTILQKLSDVYYSGTEPLVEDDVYDIMLDVLKEKDPNNSYLFQTGVSKATETDIKLPYSMPSLNKIKPGEKTLERWFKSYSGQKIIMDKLDGISGQLYIDDKGNADLFTKKQTDVGTSKKHLIKYLVDEKALKKIPKNTSIRGEIVISKKDFEDITKIDPSFKNPRSVMSGMVNTDKLDTRIANKAQYVTYAILGSKLKISEQLKKLKSWGLKTVWNDELKLDSDTNEEDNDDEINEVLQIESKLSDILKNRIEKSEFLIDGIVVSDNEKYYEHGSDNPKHAMAFKMNIATNMKDAEVEEVIWEPTMYGYLQPVIKIKPTVLSGNTTVTYVTAHNAKYVKDKKIGKGSVIKIVRSGDVIPYIVDVPKPSKEPDMPDMEYMWNDTDVEIFVVDPDDETKRKINIKKNLHFFKTIGVKYLSDGIITKLYDAGYETIASIVASANNKDEDLYEISGLGKKMITKIYDQIDIAFSKIKLPELMAGSLKFGRGMGVRKIKEIIKKYPNILEMINLDQDQIKEKILEVSGFSDILASKFSENLNDFIEFLDELKDNSNYDLSFHVEKPKDNKSSKKSAKNTTNTNIDVKANKQIEEVDMSKHKIVMTGFRSDEMTNFIERNGGKVSSGVSKNTTLVVYVEGDKLSSKLQKANDLGIQIMTREEFEKKFMNK